MQQEVLVYGLLQFILADIVNYIINEADVEFPVDILRVPDPESLLGHAPRPAV